MKASLAPQRTTTLALLVALALAGCKPSASPQAAKARLDRLKAAGRLDEVSETNFVYCAFMGDVEAVQAYLASGMSPNVKNRYGRTPLIAAAGSDPSSPWSGRNEEMVKLLIAHGADLGARDNDGDTALSLATNLKRAGVVKILKDAGARE